MKKRILSLLFIVIFSTASLFGCALLTKDNQRNYEQTVAVINPITFTYEENGVSKSWTSDKIEIIKRDLVTQLTNNFSSWYSQYQGTVEEATNYFLEQLITKELYLLHYENLYRQGLVSLRMGENGGAVNDLNNLNKSIYAAIDSQIFSGANTIRLLNGEEAVEEVEFASETGTTYPLYSDHKSINQLEQEEKEANADDFKKWTPQLIKVPSDYAEIQAMADLYNVAVQNCKNNQKATDAQKEEFDSELKQWDEWMRSKDTIKDVYTSLGSSKTFMFLLGDDVLNQIKIDKVTNYYTSIVSVSDEEIQERYNQTVLEQREKFARVEDYITAITEGEDTIMYYPISDYFYVRHILIGFSTEQTDRLTEYEANSNYTSAQKKAFREQLASEIVAYPHVNGENDLSRPMSPTEVYNEVKSVMAQLKGNVVTAEREFIKLTYKYNTDPGAFTSEQGYAIGPKPPKGQTEQMVTEFADAARELRDQFALDGQLGGISGLVLSQFGYHILFLSNVPNANSQVALNSYTAPSRLNTYYDVIRSKILEEKRASEPARWIEQNITRYLNRNLDLVTRFETRYEDLFKM